MISLHAFYCSAAAHFWYKCAATRHIPGSTCTHTHARTHTDITTTSSTHCSRTYCIEYATHDEAPPLLLCADACSVMHAGSLDPWPPPCKELRQGQVVSPISSYHQQPLPCSNYLSAVTCRTHAGTHVLEHVTSKQASSQQKYPHAAPRQQRKPCAVCMHTCQQQ